MCLMKYVGIVYIWKHSLVVRSYSASALVLVPEHILLQKLYCAQHAPHRMHEPTSRSPDDCGGASCVSGSHTTVPKPYCGVPRLAAAECTGNSQL